MLTAEAVHKVCSHWSLGLAGIHSHDNKRRLGHCKHARTYTPSGRQGCCGIVQALVYMKPRLHEIHPVHVFVLHNGPPRPWKLQDVQH